MSRAIWQGTLRSPMEWTHILVLPLARSKKLSRSCHCPSGPSSQARVPGNKQPPHGYHQHAGSPGRARSRNCLIQPTSACRATVPVQDAMGADKSLSSNSQKYIGKASRESFRQGMAGMSKLRQLYEGHQDGQAQNCSRCSGFPASSNPWVSLQVTSGRSSRLFVKGQPMQKSRGHDAS